MKKFYVLILGLFLAIASCDSGSSSSENNDDDHSSGTSEWTGTINGAAFTLNVSSSLATTQADGGVLITIEGQSTDGSSVTLSIDIAGGADIDVPEPSDDDESPSDTIQIAFGGSVNVTLEVEDDRFRGTTGSITFTSYDPNLGGQVTGSANDLGLTMLGTTDSIPATLHGTFDLAVEAPTQTDE